MKCMCAQTRPQCTLSSKKSFGGMESEPMLTPREKSPLPEAQRIGSMALHHTGKLAQHTQAWELRMEKSAEKWEPGGRRRPPVGVQGGSPLKLKLLTKIRHKNCIKQPCIFQFCQFLT